MMDYDKLYYPKIEMSQTVPTTGNSQIQDPYAVYADSFDLSLLPSTSPFTTTATTTSIKSDDDEIPLNTIQSLSLSSSSSSSSSSSLTLLPITESSPESPLVSIDYIPATIYHDQSIKLEKPWNQKDSNTNTGHNNNTNNNCEDKKDITISSNKITAAAISHHQTSSSSLSSDTSILLQQFQKHYQFYPSPLPSPPQESSASSSITTSGGVVEGGGGGTISIYPPSPCPSIEQNQNFQNFHIKQEFHILPPSPPESNGAPSPAACFIDIKSEPETDTSETLLDISSLLENSITSSSSSSSHSLSQRESSSISQQQQQQQSQNHQQIVQVSKKPAQDHQLLREYLQDTSFQKKHNLKPLALESLFGGFGVRADIEPVISLALEHAKRDAQATCALLKISPDPQQWTTSQVHAWIRSTIEQFKLPSNNDIEMKFPENGSALMCLSEDEFNRRVPEAGSTIHAQLEIWKLACSENFSTDFGLSPTTTILPPSTINGSLISNSTWNSNTNCSDTMNMDMDISGDEDEEMIQISATTSIHHHHHHHDNSSNISVIPLGGTSTPPAPPQAPSMVTTATSPSMNNEINSTTSLLTPNTTHQIITSTDCTTVDINGTINTSTNAATLLLSKSTKTSKIATIAATATPSTATVAATATPSSLTTIPAATTPKSGTRPSSSHIHLWQFLKELLASPQLHGTAIRWLDRSKGVFKIEDSVRVAKLWGRRKNRPAMNYDKLSRSIRQYYKKGIMKKTERSQRLVYQFCHPYSL